MLEIKVRTDRRPGLAIEPIWRFYPRRIRGVVGNSVAFLRQALLLHSLRRKIERDSDRLSYTDQALTPVAENETDTLELFTHNEGARQAVRHSRKIAELTGVNNSG